MHSDNKLDLWLWTDKSVSRNRNIYQTVCQNLVCQNPTNLQGISTNTLCLYPWRDGDCDIKDSAGWFGHWGHHIQPFRVPPPELLSSPDCVLSLAAIYGPGTGVCQTSFLPTEYLGTSAHLQKPLHPAVTLQGHSQTPGPIWSEVPIFIFIWTALTHLNPNLKFFWSFEQSFLFIPAVLRCFPLIFEQLKYYSLKLPKLFGTQAYRH